MHRLLERQLGRYVGEIASAPPEWQAFVQAVDEAYEQAEEQGYALLDVVRTVAAGNLDVEVEAREGLAALSELAAGLQAMVVDLRERSVEQMRARADAERARQELDAALQQVLAVQRRYVRESWETYTVESQMHLGYVLDEGQEVAPKSAWLPAMADAIHQVDTVTVQDDRDGSELAVPITFYDEVLGVLGFSRNGQGWSETELEIVRSVVDQVAQALENQRLLDEQQRVSYLMSKRVKELDFLSDIGRRIDESPPLGEFLQWVAERIPAAMLHPDVCVAAVRLGEQVYGASQAVDLPRQMVQGLRVGGELVGQVYVAYTQDYDFMDEESALLGNVSRRVSGYIEIRRLLEQMQVRSEELVVLNELGQALTARLDLDDVLQEAYRQVSRLMYAENFHIGLYDPEREMIDIRFEVSDSEIDKAITSVSVQEGIGGYIVRNRTSVLLPDNVRERQKELGIDRVGQEAASWLGVPMMLGDRVLGVIGVQSHTTPRLYGEHERELLTTIAASTAIAIQNARLLEQARSRAEESRVLYEMGRLLSARLDIDQVLDAVYRSVARLVQADNFYIGLYDAVSNQVTFPLDVTESVVDKNITVISADDGITGYIIRSGESVLISQDVHEWLAERDISVIGENAQCYLGVPLRLGDQVQGVMAVQSYDASRMYDQHDLELLTTIASQVAAAIQNARLFEQARTHANEQAVLAEMGRALTTRLDADAVIENIHQYASRLLDTTNFYVAMYDSSTGQIRFPLAREKGKRVAWRPRDFGQGMTEYVLQSREPLLVRENLARWLEAAGVASIGQETTSWLGVPMVIEEEAIGVIAVQSDMPRRYDEHDQALLLSIASQASIAIQNARLLASAQARARREQILREITMRLRGSTDPDVIVRAAVRELGTVLGRRAFVRLGSAEQLAQAPATQEGGE